MKLRTVSRWFFVLVVAALVANFVFLLLIRTAYLSAEQAGQRRAETLRLVSDLQNESLLLRRLVSAYTGTASPRYLLYYYDLLAIREGSKPQPASLGDTGDTGDALLYWNEVIAGLRPHALPEGVPGRSLRSRMQALDFGRAEIDAAEGVLAATERLMKTEQVAFAATQGLYDRRTQAYVSEGVPDLAYASQLVHSPAYETQSAELARALSKLSHITDQRTAEHLQRSETELQRYIVLALAVDLALLPGLLAGMHVVRTRVLRPIDRLGQVARRLARGDYATRAGGRDHWAEELDTLGVTLNVMAHAVQDDVNQRARAQLDLQEARDQAEAATKAKSMFLANMSHEIRTPLNGVLGIAGALARTDLAPKQRHMVNLIEGSGRALERLLSDILDLAKLDAGRVSIREERFDLANAVREIAELFQASAAEKGVELLVELDEASRDRFIGDELRIRQVLSNLVSNAVKFTARGEVRLSVTGAPLPDGRERVRFAVRDTGIGFPPDAAETLFERFEQADGSVTRQYGGTGLGLAISKSLATLMGGTISATSAPGRGATFKVELPLRRVVQDGPILEVVQSSAIDGSMRPLRLLLAEDHLINRMTVELILEELPVEIVAVENGREAVEVFAGQAFDLVLMDMQMPVMDGLAAIRAIREIEREFGRTRTPICVLSANAMDEHKEAADAAGADAFLTKPINAGGLITYVAGVAAKTT